MVSLAVFLVASLVASQATAYVQLSGELKDDQVQCSFDGNGNQFDQYGASFSTDGSRTIAAEYNETEVQCCVIDFASGTKLSPEDLSMTAGSTPCSELAECKASCDENASCLFSEGAGFDCQCNELYEGDGETCTRKPYWSEWGDFGPVSQTCGEGATKTRTRTCSQPERCEGSDTDTVSVDLDACPEWSAWSKFGPNSKSCGNGATKTRTRTCSQPGKCIGADKETVKVNLPACPVWSAWGAYGPYSRTCGNGVTKTRTRTCSVSGKCVGSAKQTVKVNLSACPTKKKTSPPANTYQICGTKKCKWCSNKYSSSSCERSGLSRTTSKGSLKGCPSGYYTYTYKYEGRKWSWFKYYSYYTRVCRSNTPAGQTRYLICSRIQCLENTSTNQRQLVAQSNQNLLKSCPSGYKQKSMWRYGSGYFRQCYSTKKYWY